MKLTDDEKTFATLNYQRDRVDPDWLGHIPFARLLTLWLKPKLFMELGVRRGQSFCAFCDAISYADLTCQAIGVDHWQGDKHTKYDGNSVFQELQNFCQLHYPFAILWRQSFDEALPLVGKGSIDLLHIDGTHTQSAVKHDFESWLSKVDDNGVILFHDTCWPDGDVDQFWRKEIAPHYPNQNFIHSFGLGVALKGPIELYPKRLQQFIGLPRDDFYIFNQDIIHLAGMFYD
jgi:hypothetical protein